MTDTTDKPQEKAPEPKFVPEPMAYKEDERERNRQLQEKSKSQATGE